MCITQASNRQLCLKLIEEDWNNCSRKDKTGGFVLTSKDLKCSTEQRTH